MRSRRCHRPSKSDNFLRQGFPFPRSTPVLVLSSSAAGPGEQGLPWHFTLPQPSAAEQSSAQSSRSSPTQHGLTSTSNLTTPPLDAPRLRLYLPTRPPHPLQFSAIAFAGLARFCPPAHACRTTPDEEWARGRSSRRTGRKLPFILGRFNQSPFSPSPCALREIPPSYPPELAPPSRPAR